MSDSSYSFNDERLIEELARNINLAKSEYPQLPEVERKIDRQAIEAVFYLLLKRVVLQREVYLPITNVISRQQSSNVFDKIIPTLWMKLSAIGAAFFILSAILLYFINSTATAPIAIYLLLGILFFFCLILQWNIQIVKQTIKSYKENAQKGFEKARNIAVDYEAAIVEEIAKTANFDRAIVLYVANQIQSELEVQEERNKLADKNLRIAALVVVVTSICIFIPVQTIMNTLLSGNIASLVAAVAVLSALSGSVMVIYEWLGEQNFHWKTISYKICLNLLRQAQLLLEV